jgi:hypothetical protein
MPSPLGGNTTIKESIMETEKKKKGLLETIWESMTQTGGCCGSGGSCCGPSKEDAKRTIEKEAEEKSEK